MEDKTLIKQFAGEFQNNNLPGFGQTVFVLTPGLSVSPAFTFTGMEKATIDGDAYFTDSTGTSNLGQEVTSSPFYIKNITDGNLLKVTSKYDFTIVKVAEQTGNRTFKENTSIDFSYWSKTEIIEISKLNNNVDADLNVLTKDNGVLNLFKWHYNTHVVGDIETAVENLVNNGRSSGALVIGAAYSNILLNDNNFMRSGAIEFVKITFNSATNVVVNAGEDGSGALLASWNGTTWTYPS